MKLGRRSLSCHGDPSPGATRDERLSSKESCRCGVEPRPKREAVCAVGSRARGVGLRKPLEPSQLHDELQTINMERLNLAFSLLTHFSLV